MTLEILNEWVLPALFVAGALVMMAVGILRDRATQKELDRLYDHEDKVEKAGIYIEIIDGELGEVKAMTPNEVLYALLEALGTHMGRHLPEDFTLGDMMELVTLYLRSTAVSELRRQGRTSAATPTRHERLLERMESKDFAAALLQLGTDSMNRCAWCDRDKRQCGVEDCTPQRERECVLQWLSEKPDGDGDV